MSEPSSVGGSGPPLTVSAPAFSLPPRSCCPGILRNFGADTPRTPGPPPPGPPPPGTPGFGSGVTTLIFSASIFWPLAQLRICWDSAASRSDISCRWRRSRSLSAFASLDFFSSSAARFSSSARCLATSAASPLSSAICPCAAMSFCSESFSAAVASNIFLDSASRSFCAIARAASIAASDSFDTFSATSSFSISPACEIASLVFRMRASSAALIFSSRVLAFRTSSVFDAVSRMVFSSDSISSWTLCGGSKIIRPRLFIIRRDHERTGSYRAASSRPATVPCLRARS